MIIRPEQMETFDRDAERRFIDELTKFVGNRCAGAPKADDVKLRQMVEHGIRRARSHGLTWESSLSKFVMLMFEVAPNFDEYPPFWQILNKPDLTPDERLPLIFENLTIRNVRGAAKRYDARAWHQRSQEQA